MPNLQIGSFSAITPFASLLKDRRQLWDVAAAGPAAGVAVSVLLLAVGLSQSAPGGGLTPDQLVPVPSTLFQGSLLLGGLARLVLGEAAMRSQDVMISPLVVAGWCGLVSNALNLLPVGQLDGGRLVQAAYGRGRSRCRRSSPTWAWAWACWAPAWRCPSGSTSSSASARRSATSRTP